MKKSVTLIITLVIISTISFYALAASKPIVNIGSKNVITSICNRGSVTKTSVLIFANRVFLYNKYSANILKSLGVNLPCFAYCVTHKRWILMYVIGIGYKWVYTYPPPSLCCQECGGNPCPEWLNRMKSK